MKGETTAVEIRKSEKSNFTQSALKREKLTTEHLIKNGQALYVHSFQGQLKTSVSLMYRDYGDY